MIMEAMSSSETSVLTRAMRRHIPEHDILHSHRRENLKNSGSRHRSRRCGYCCIVVGFRTDLEAPKFMTDYKIITRTFIGVGKTR
jgi:hypothetical protein